MRHVYEVLKEKETAIKRLREEIKALRLVCQMLHHQDDSTPNAFEPIVEQEDETHIILPVDEKEASLAGIRARLLDRQRNSALNKSVLFQVRQAALGASRTFLSLFERLGRSQAA